MNPDRLRRVSGLYHVSRRAVPGFPKPNSVSARAGLAYEKKAVKALRGTYSILHNPCYFFQDAEGAAHCCPDVVFLLSSNRIAIAEIKLTYKDEAAEKLRYLYAPVLSFFHGDPNPILFIIAKSLIPSAPEPEPSLESILNVPSSWQKATKVPVLHWLGKGAIL